MNTYQRLLRDTASFNHTINFTRKIFKSKEKVMLDCLPILYRKPRQLDPPHEVLVEPVKCVEPVDPVEPVKSQASCSIKPSSSRSSVTVNRASRRKIFHRSKRPMRVRRVPALLFQTLAETKKNYKTLMSLIGTAGTKEGQSDI